MAVTMLAPMATAPPRDVALDESRRRHDEPGGDQSVSSAGIRVLRPPLLAALALTALLVFPLAVGLVHFRRPPWTPVLDLAQTELRVRDVGTSHTPLIGLPGRINVDGQQGSHPGPLSFYALAPVYRLLGGSSYAMQVSTVVLHAGAILVALVIARRRGGTVLLLGVAAAIALFVNGLGVTTLSEPWNPYVPLLWWIVVLLAVWSVVEGDVAMLPVAVAAASLCAQTHVPYLVLCLGAGALAAGAALVRLRGAPPAARRRTEWWLAAAAGVGVVLWLPPVIDQFTSDHGNLGILIDYFTHTPPGESTTGMREAVRIVLQRLDVFHLSVDQLAHPGLLVSFDPGRQVHAWRGAVLLAVWLVAVGAALRLGHRALLRLHLVVAVGLALLVVDVSHIYGKVWYYLLLPAWSVTLLMVIATVWTAAVTFRWFRGRGREPLPATGRAAAAVLLTVTLVACGRVAAVAPDAMHSDPNVVADLAAVVPGTVRALNDRVAPATGTGGHYLVSWDDAAYIGSPGYGLLNELDRRGFDVGGIEGLRVIETPHRVMPEDRATARVALATGVWIDRWRAVPGATQVAFFDPRTPEQQARFAALRAAAIDELHAAGLDDVARNVDLNLFAAANDPRVPPATYDKLNQLFDLGVPIAVFIAPPGAHA